MLYNVYFLPFFQMMLFCTSVASFCLMLVQSPIMSFLMYVMTPLQSLHSQGVGVYPVMLMLAFVCRVSWRRATWMLCVLNIFANSVVFLLMPQTFSWMMLISEVLVGLGFFLFLHFPLGCVWLFGLYFLFRVVLLEVGLAPGA